MLGLEAPEAELAAAFRIASATRLVRGFAVGRTIFADAADKWLSGRMTDQEAVADMAARFESLVSIWKETQHVQAARKTAR
jgi:5-dehydro-2-deoxygluconokinase